jgi:hypothetical protein
MGEISLSELKYPEKFSAFMDQLLNKKFGSTPIRPPNDRGRDSYIKDDDENFIIYQYKFYLTAKDFKKKDVEESLKTAVKNYGGKIKEWILCLPRKITSREEDFLQELSKKWNVKISFVGEAEIQNLINETDFPIENYLNSQLYRKSRKDVKFIKNTLLSKSKEPKEIKFEILGKVVDHLISSEKEELQEENFSLIGIEDKIKKNKLSPSFGDLLKLEMLKFPQIDLYLKSGAISSKDINKVLAVLKVKYLKFRNKFDNGDDIFVALIEEIVPNNCDEEEYEAYVAIVCYFFQACEVFEK